MDIVKIDNPTWSGDIKTILEDIEDGIFGEIDAIENDRLGLDWWYLKSNDEVVGVLWIMCGEDEILYKDQGEVAEISFCFRKEYRKKGMLTSLMEQIEGLVKSTYKDATLILAVVKKTNPFLESVVKTLEKYGYSSFHNSSNILLEKEIESSNKANSNNEI